MSRSAWSPALLVALICALVAPARADDRAAPAERAERAGPAESVERAARTAASAEPAEVVVLLHGLARSERAMRPLAQALAAGGYEVHNLDYASTEHTPGELVASLHEQLGACCERASRLHFVTHSLGGIVVRAYLVEHHPAKLGRVVMLAPPNRGSELVDGFGESGWFRAAFGPTGTDLGTADDSLPNRLPEPDYEVGVIAGTRSVNPIGSAMIPDRDDGAVSVERTRLPGSADFITVERTHTFIMRAPEVAEQILHFLRQGRFARPATE